MADLRNAAEELEGRQLDGGWTVAEKIGRHRLDTGGNFSINYRVVHRDGRKAFLKALNLAYAATQPDPAQALQAMTGAFNFERQLLARCGDTRMSRVVRAIDDGTVTIQEIPLLGTVNYLIFEDAEGGDVRAYLRDADRFDVAFSFRSLHHVAAALCQLHGVGIAHQDLKPSNVLVFPGDAGRKVSDLGRASLREREGPFDGLPVPGDPHYAPPELLYQHVPTGWHARRQASDLYQLGSLLLFFFTDLSASTALRCELHPDHTPQNWRQDFRRVIPYLEDAFERVVATLEGALPPTRELKDPAVLAFRQLCAPDPTRRGHPSARRGSGSNFATDRYRTLFDLLACRSEYSLTRPQA